MPPVSRDAVKRMKRMDLAFANEVLTGEGEQVDKAAPKRWRAEAAAERAEAFVRGGRGATERSLYQSAVGSG